VDSPFDVVEELVANVAGVAAVDEEDVYSSCFADGTDKGIQGELVLRPALMQVLAPLAEPSPLLQD